MDEDLPTFCQRLTLLLKSPGYDPEGHAQVKILLSPWCSPEGYAKVKIVINDINIFVPERCCSYATVV